MPRLIPGDSEFRKKLHEIIFEADTPEGKAFDVILLVMIALSIFIVMLESVESLAIRYKEVFFVSEWVLTILFTIEYVLRIIAIKRPVSYVTSNLGIIDLLALLPTYLSLFFPGSQSLGTIRALRLLRIFRIFKLARYLKAFRLLALALRNARPKIIVFLIGVITFVVFIGSAMYLIEGDSESGFTSIPRAMYWAIVTITTVGYGDIAPSTPFGQFMSAILMLVGYSIIAVPTGIVSVEISRTQNQEPVDNRACENCSSEGHAHDANFCYNCGHDL